jgi:hypothetical protein
MSNQPTNPSGPARPGAWPLTWNLPPGGINGSTPNGAPFGWRPVFQQVSVPPAAGYPAGPGPFEASTPSQLLINAAKNPEPVGFSRGLLVAPSGPLLIDNARINFNTSAGVVAGGAGAQGAESHSSQHVVEVALSK